MRRTATVRWMEAAEARRFRQMALEMPAPPTERQGRLLAALRGLLRLLTPRLETARWRPARPAVRSPAQVRRLPTGAGEDPPLLRAAAAVRVPGGNSAKPVATARLCSGRPVVAAACFPIASWPAA
jgi:hypothetical protein